MEKRSSRSSRSSSRDDNPDINTLSESLGMNVESMKEIMSSQGSGLRSEKDKNGTGNESSRDAKAPWAAFLETVGDSNDIGNGNGNGADKKDIVKDYVLPICFNVPEHPGLLAQTGTLDVSLHNRAGSRKERFAKLDLEQPTLLCPEIFSPRKISYIATSCSSSHSVAVDTNGVPYLWGKNDHHQCGFSSEKIIMYPQLVHDGPWNDLKIVTAATGKYHSMLLAEDGNLYGIGRNNLGQLGVGTFAPSVASWRKCLVGAKDEFIKVVQVSCGETFSCLLSDEGFLYNTGCSEFGQLGNGGTGEYFVTANKLAFANCSKFERRSVFVAPEKDTAYVRVSSDEKTVALKDSSKIRLSYISCGRNHTTAIEADWKDRSSQRRVFSWGCGNYGRLGHGVQQDEYFPRVLSFFRSQFFTRNSPVISSSGTQCSLILTEKGHVYYWGKHRVIGEATMKPELVEALANNAHVVNNFACGNTTVVCSTSLGATVAWGQGTYGELGFDNRKSSVRPSFVNMDCILTQLSCGFGHTLFLLKDENEDDLKVISKLKTVQLADLEQYKPIVHAQPLPIAKDGKRKGSSTASAKKKKKQQE